MHYYEVAPLTKLVNHNGLLTYSSIGELCIGEIVEVPIRGSKKIAVVISSSEKPTYNTKEIVRSLGESYRLDSAHISLARFISERYFCSLGEALQAMIPTSIFKKRREIKPSKDTASDSIIPELTADQENALRSITQNGTDKPTLLFGVTGSGKTEIYMRVIAEVLGKGKTAILLVPEISLTPQTEKRIKDRFGSIVGVIHSNLLETERAKLWREIDEGTVRVVIGPRSALFSPLKNIGAIIIDEAHESSYKQEQTPRYHAVKVAEELARLSSAFLILGTATPKIEQYFKTQNKQYNLVTLNNRIVQTCMPDVEIVDMRNEFHYRNFSIFSSVLQTAINKALEDKKQILLFVNRRGMSTFVSCRECGYVEKCPNCDISMTYHMKENKLICHHCTEIATPPVKCPACGSLAIKYFGTGTEKVENEAKKMFTTANIIRMDSDTTTKTGSHDQIYRDIKSGKGDIIIGTQMIAKGWDIANIDLVGIISADPMINMPDYEAESRALSLMMQVAGRTGRGDTKGSVILQTYNPDLPIFKSIESHNYLEFYEKEIRNRQNLSYPPFVKMIELLYNNESESTAKEEAIATAKNIENKLAENKLGYQVTASPSPILRLHGKYRWQINIKIYDTDNIDYTILNNIFVQTTTKDWVINAEPNG